jgi:hypothetical protein
MSRSTVRLIWSQGLRKYRGSKTAVLLTQILSA